MPRFASTQLRSASSFADSISAAGEERSAERAVYAPRALAQKL